MPKLSIIVPVYKVEQYLHKCIDSILSQTFTDFELILIDDGSPDRCGEICDEYAAKDERIIVIHQKSQGVSAARNAGLDIARGEYIGFVDSDDWIESRMYEIMLATAKNKQVDVVICGCHLWLESEEYLCNDLMDEGEYDRKVLLRNMYESHNPLGGVLWNKIFRFDPIKEVRFREHMQNCEDGVFIIESFFRYNSGIKLGIPFYNVLQRNSSASRSNDIGRVFHTVCGFVEIKNLLKQYPHESVLDDMALKLVLDNCVRFSKQILMIHSETGAPCKKELKEIRKIMITCISKVILRRSLSIRKIHGYIHELCLMRIS